MPTTLLAYEYELPAGRFPYRPDAPSSAAGNLHWRLYATGTARKVYEIMNAETLRQCEAGDKLTGNGAERSLLYRMKWWNHWHCPLDVLLPVARLRYRTNDVMTFDRLGIMNMANEIEARIAEALAAYEAKTDYAEIVVDSVGMPAADLALHVSSGSNLWPELERLFPE